MKSPLALILLLAGFAVNAGAQIFTPSIVSGAALGAVSGAVMGGSTRSAAIGATIGISAGHHSTFRHKAPPANSPRRCPRARSFGTSLVSKPGLVGAAIGGAAGAVVGSRSHFGTGKGAAVGAVAGLLAGVWVDRSRSRESSAITPADALTIRDARSPSELARIFGPQASP